MQGNDIKTKFLRPWIYRSNLNVNWLWKAVNLHRPDINAIYQKVTFTWQHAEKQQKRGSWSLSSSHTEHDVWTTQAALRCTSNSAFQRLSTLKVPLFSQTVRSKGWSCCFLMTAICARRETLVKKKKKEALWLTKKQPAPSPRVHTNKHMHTLMSKLRKKDWLTNPEFGGKLKGNYG